MKNQTKNTQLYSGSILGQFDSMVHRKRSRGSYEFWLLVTTSAVLGRICKLESVLQRCGKLNCVLQRFGKLNWSFVTGDEFMICCNKTF